MSAEEIVERIMTMHWDMAACNCWICVNGREAGMHPGKPYLKRDPDTPYVAVKGMYGFFND